VVAVPALGDVLLEVDAGGVGLGHSQESTPRR
jgi:hypothetical protein